MKRVLVLLLAGLALTAACTAQPSPPLLPLRLSGALLFRPKRRRERKRPSSRRLRCP